MFEKKSRVGYIYDELTERRYFNGIEIVPLENDQTVAEGPRWLMDDCHKGIHVGELNKTIIRLPWIDLKGPYAEKGKLSHLNSPNVKYTYEQLKHDQNTNLEADKLEAKEDLLAKIGVTSSQVSIKEEEYVEYEEDFVIGSNQYFEEKKLSLIYYLNNLVENLVIYQLLVNIFNFLHYISDKEEE